MYFKKDVNIVVGDSPLISAVSSPPKLVNQSLQSVGTLVRVVDASFRSIMGIRSQFFLCTKEISRYERNQHPTLKNKITQGLTRHSLRNALFIRIHTFVCNLYDPLFFFFSKVYLTNISI